MVEPSEITIETTATARLESIPYDLLNWKITQERESFVSLETNGD
jgi:hypothetical protein